jgi:hypothetical protein
MTSSPDRPHLGGLASLLDTLASELERPRPLLPQVIKHLGGTYGLERDALGPFLDEKLATLEDFEIDLILSPMFTPSLPEQAVFAELLGATAVPAEEWPALIQQLVARPTRGHLVTEDGQTHGCLLREVILERYVQRLRLGATIPAPLFALVSQLPPQADRPLLKAVARRAIWGTDGRREILFRYLSAVGGREDYSLEDFIALLKLMETYSPPDGADLLRRVPQWEQVLRHEVNLAANPKAFFNERVQELHGGGRDQRRPETAAADQKERELRFLGRLRGVLGN